MPYFLGIETSFHNTALALLGEETEISLSDSYPATRHQESLFPLLSYLFQSFHLAVKDLSGIGVTIGPGMFTSLRVGLAAAKSLALPHQIPVKGITTFLGLTETYYEIFPEEEGRLIPVIDAKKNQVYAQVYQKKEATSEPELISPEEIVKKYPDAIFFGSGIKSAPEVFQKVRRANILFPSPVVIARRAREAILKGEADALPELVPFYLKEPEIRRK
jgi:tRNA threonylcarbamoyladenosine biosynthesis protein TsaB|uniref:tRNA (Adenosine(37)-N6)-threonylcarbamoyltransferase complex dimerization subunit type 1 TsaB n=1 Tax=candidate division WOR-3 bacterium TaxID=2052148 RepID=A0A7C3UY56_UNCW3